MDSVNDVVPFSGEFPLNISLHWLTCPKSTATAFSDASFPRNCRIYSPARCCLPLKVRMLKWFLFNTTDRPHMNTVRAGSPVQLPIYYTPQGKTVTTGAALSILSAALSIPGTSTVEAIAGDLATVTPLAATASAIDYLASDVAAVPLTQTLPVASLAAASTVTPAVPSIAEDLLPLHRSPSPPPNADIAPVDVTAPAAQPTMVNLAVAEVAAVGDVIHTPLVAPIPHLVPAAAATAVQPQPVLVPGGPDQAPWGLYAAAPPELDNPAPPVAPEVAVDPPVAVPPMPAPAIPAPEPGLDAALTVFKDIAYVPNATKL